MLPICAFAHIFHHSIPGLSHPVEKRKHLGSIFRFTVIFCIVAYSLVAWRLGTVLGEATNQSVNLNWNTYHPENSPRWLTRCIAMYIVCFPALDVLSAFPLNAITLGNNLLGAAYGKDVHTAEVRTLHERTLLVFGSFFFSNCLLFSQKNRCTKIQFRLLASGPPILLALLLRELGTITDYAGTTGFIIGFSFPALLYIRSRKLAEKKEFATETQYTSYGSNVASSLFVFVFGPAMVMYVVVNLIKGTGNE
jgi:hypothetical protein